MIDWDDLRVFHEAVRSGDYSSAARKLGIDRTTIGRRLARLERSVGREVWLLADSGYRPTAFGATLLAVAAAMESGLAEIERHLPAPLSLRFAGTAGLAELVIPELASLVPRDIMFELIPALDGIAALQSRHADLALAITREPPAGLDGVRIAAFEQARYVRDRVGSAATIGWSHALMLANPQGWARLNQVKAAACEVPSISAMHVAIAAGLGSGWLWTRLGDADPRLDRLFAQPPVSAASDLWLLHRAEPAPSPTVVVLRDQLAARLQAASSLIPNASPAAR